MTGDQGGGRERKSQRPTNSLEIPRSALDYRDEEVGLAEPFDWSYSEDYEEEQRERVMLNQWRAGVHMLETAEDQEDLGEFTELTGIEVGEEQIAAILEMPAQDRVIALLAIGELDDRDLAHLASLERTSEEEKKEYRRNKGLLGRLGTGSFEQGHDGSWALGKDALRESKVRGMILHEFQQRVSAEEFEGLEGEDQGRVNEQIIASLEFEQYVTAIGQNEEAQQDLYMILKRREEDPDVTDEEIIEQLIILEQAYELTPHAAQQKDKEDQEQAADQSYIEYTEERAEEVVRALGLDDYEGEVKVVGKNRYGDVILEFDQTTQCAVSMPYKSKGPIVIHWVKITAGENEYVHEDDYQAKKPQNFREELGRARSDAVLAHYDIPFRGSSGEGKKFIEVVAVGGAEVSNGATFRYDQYNQVIDDELVLFLEALTPDNNEGATTQTMSELGVFVDGTLDQERLKSITWMWGDSRYVKYPEEFLDDMLEMYGPIQETEDAE